MKDFPVTYTATVNFTAERVNDLLTSAFEGGSNYWIESIQRVGPKVGTYIQDHALDSEKGVLIKVYDDDHAPYEFNQSKAHDGLQLMAKNYPRHFSDFLSENDDAETADVFLQCALFGEVIFS